MAGALSVVAWAHIALGCVSLILAASGLLVGLYRFVGLGYRPSDPVIQ